MKQNTFRSVSEEAAETDRLIATRGGLSKAIAKLQCLLARMQEMGVPSCGAPEDRRDYRLAASALRDLKRARS